MVISVRRKNREVGTSNFMNIPKPTEVGEESTIVVDRVILADPRGIIPENELQEFMETHVEPAFWAWMQKRKAGAQHVPA